MEAVYPNSIMSVIFDCLVVGHLIRIILIQQSPNVINKLP